MTRMTSEEGTAASTIEQPVVKLPTNAFFWAAAGSIATSLALRMMGQRDASLFVGQWAPTFLILGVYNKLAKAI